MKKIKLTRGLEALVDDEDFERLSQYKWQGYRYKQTFYAQRGTKRKDGCQKTIRMHREILDCPKGMQVDHIDGNGLNNCKSNLRIVTSRQNAQNRHCVKTSKYPGVYWSKCAKKWQAAITVGGKGVYLGIFANEEDAFEAYLKGLQNIGGIFIPKKEDVI